MKKISMTNGKWLIIAGIVCLGCGAAYLLNNKAESKSEVDEFLASYAEMMDGGEEENVLIVVSQNYPEMHGAKRTVEGPNHTYYLMYDTAEQRDYALNEYAKDDSLSVEKNEIMKLASYNSWGIEAMGLDKGVKALDTNGNNVKVAIVDTGLDVELFRDSYPFRYLSAYDVESDSDELEDMKDEDGHGTHIAGTIAEGTTSLTEIMAIRAEREGNLYVSDINTAIYKAADEGADVINLSLGGEDYSESQKAAVDYANAKNAIVVAAAGNNNNSIMYYPAGYDNTISVAALDLNLNRAVWDASRSLGSNYNNMVDYAAPGTNIYSINGYKSGTSMATPHVVAAVALLKGYNKDLTLDQVNGLLRNHVVDLGDEGRDDYYGYGMIDFTDAEFCDGIYCDEYGVFTAPVPEFVKAEIDDEDIVLTELNYYSIQNLLLTKVKLYIDETRYLTRELQDIVSLEISGYDPESSEEQTVTVSCEGVSTTIKVTNPADYPSGWEYETNEKNEIVLTDYTDIRDIDYSDNEIIRKIYVPGSIDGKNVVSLSGREVTVHFGDDDDDDYYVVWHAAFSGSNVTSQAKEVYLPESLTDIGKEAFYNFSTLKKVVMAADAVKVGDYAFFWDRKLETVEGSIIELGEYAFKDAEALEEITLAEGMTIIPESALASCYSLKHITIPSTVTLIDNYAFFDDRSLESVEFAGNNLKRTGYNVFSQTYKLHEIILPEGIEELGYNAFYNSGIVNLYIPASLTEIPSGVFDGCGNLETIVVDEDNPRYFDVSDQVLMSVQYSDVVLLRGTKYFGIPNGTTRIGGGAFSGNTTLMAPITIPDTVKYIEYNAFYGCTGLTEVTIPKETNVSNSAFAAGMDENYDTVQLDVKLNVYFGSLAYDYAVDYGLNYETMDASYTRIIAPFNYGDSLTGDEEIEMYFDYGVKENGVFTNYTGMNGHKITGHVSDLVSATYSGDVGYFRIGDTYFIARYIDYLNNEAEIKVNVTVNGELPSYTVPTGLTGKLRALLNTVVLPEGFSWMHGREIMSELGTRTYLAIYTPENTEMYAPIENIRIEVEVVPGRIKLPEPEVTIESKVYDGDWGIDSKYITVNIEGLDVDDYTAFGWTYETSGTTTAVVNISLSSEAAEEYGWGDDYSSYYTYTLENYVILDQQNIEVDNITGGVADVEVLGDGITVTAEKACVVIISTDGTSYSRVVATPVAGEENKYKFEFDVSSVVDVKVVLKGDGDMDGVVSSSDTNLINRSLISPTLGKRYRALTDLERILFDLDGDGVISTGDVNIINKSLISPTLRPYKKIQW